MDSNISKSLVDNYLKDLDKDQKAALEHIRQLIKKMVPDTIEVMSYGMPGFKYKNKYFVGYAAFKNHMSLFPTSRPIEQLQDKLLAYKLSKGTIQFTLENPIPDTLIKELLQVRLTDIS